MGEQGMACLVAISVLLGAAPGSTQEPEKEPPSAIDRPAGESPYDVPPRLLRNWGTPYTIPKHGGKKPPDANVVLEILIDAKGRVAKAHVVRSVPYYDDIVIAYAKSWLFSPALKDGRPVAVEQLVSIHLGATIDRESMLLWDRFIAPSPPAQGGANPKDSLTAAGPPAPPSLARTEQESAAPAPPATTPLPVSGESTPRAEGIGSGLKVEILSPETHGADFTEWLGSFVTAVSRDWAGPKPPSADARFEVEIARDGSVNHTRIVQSSGIPDFDRAGMRALFAGLFPPLPARYPARTFRLVVRFASGEGGAPAIRP